MRDLVFKDEGTIWLVVPVTEAGEEWVKDHIPADAQKFGTAIVVEHRFVNDIWNGAQADGLNVGERS